MAAAGPRYAPEDPTLPKPWRGLIDGSTGYLYFWNPETNVTQYERPAPKQPSGPAAPHPKSSSTAVSSSVHGQQSYGSGYGKEGDGRYGGSRSHHDSRSNGYMNGPAADSRGYNHSDASNNSRLSLKGHGPAAVSGGILSVEAYCRQHEITTNGDNMPAPFMTFESTGFPAEILKELHHAGFSAPTPIQAQSWPIAMQSRDIVAVAKTGSGKTLGYLLPGFLHLNRLRNNAKMGPTVLVLSPTRELATQILDEAVKFGKSSRLACTCLYGGAPKGPQLRDLDRGVDIVVATPGRLNDILEMRRVSLHQVSYLVLDEADRMLDMGFEPQIRKIVKEIPARRQTLMYTATWPKEVRKIAADLLVNPVQVNIGNIDELVANKSITQYVEMVMPMEKQRRLEQILRSQEPGSKIIVFCSTKRMCDQLARTLTRQFGAAAIHGDKSQSERDHVLSQFRNGKSPILVATDVAARGLDIKDIRVVVNYDFPTGVEDYVHRIGRTGRAGATGLAYTFFSDQDSKHASDLIKVLEGANQQVPPEIREMGSRGGYGKFRRWGAGPGGGGGGRDGGRSYGSDRDSGYGGRGGRGSSGRFDSGYGGRGDRDSSGGRGGDRDRYESRSYHDAHVNNARGRPGTTSSWGNSGSTAWGRDLGRSNSPHGHVQDSRRSRSRSRSKHGGYSPGRKSHSRSRSRSPRKFNGDMPQHVRSPMKRGSSPNGNDVASMNGIRNQSAPKRVDNGWQERDGHPPPSSLPPNNGEEEEEGMIPEDGGGVPGGSDWAARAD